MQKHSRIIVLSSLCIFSACAAKAPAPSGQDITACQNALVRWNGGATATEEEKAVCDRASKEEVEDLQLSLGYAYMKGIGVKKDEIQGIRYFTAAADKGNTDAQYNLGLSYAKGLGVKQDMKQSAQWFLGAAVKDDRASQYALGIMFALGEGVAKDPVQSYAWFSVSAKNGFSDAQRSLDELKKTMTPDQLKKGEEHAALFQSRIEKGRSSAQAVSSEAASSLPPL